MPAYIVADAHIYCPLSNAHEVGRIKRREFLMDKRPIYARCRLSGIVKAASGIDLSMPDAAFTIPLNLPLLGNAINILPILMIGAMILQQKISQGKTTSGAQLEQQKIMGMVMPVMFGFIFYSLPSRLVLYWLTNTILTTSLQLIFLKKA